ncbi:MAG: hypothetical protein HRT68_04575 [Flavobacteriaceae bacterium]|nr:hypothetical protein [Flavobacteriaceae bacterium]
MMTLKFHNQTGNKDLYLFFNYTTTNSSGESGFSDMSYLQPWKNGNLALDEAYECSFDWINSGTFWYMITNETGAATIAAHPNTAMGTADKNWVGGFFELTSLESAKKAYFDITNVDQVGLFCGIKFSDGNKCGYGKPANDFISGLETACDLGSSTSAKITITGTDGVSYSKLWGPTVPEVSSEYNGAYDEYITAITNNKTALTIVSDKTKDSGHGGTELGSFTFKGTWGQPDSLPAGSSLNKEDVILWFEADDCTSAGTKTYIYLTDKGLNGATIMGGSSSGGMYVYPAFEYYDPSAPNNIGKGGWAEDVSLNWTATGENAVADTTCFQAMIDSVIRDLITALNLGYIGVTAAHNTFTYGDSSTYASAATQAKYLNEWNNYITSNSDSYGMAYSDNAHEKVQFNPPINGTIDCYILKQDDANTKTYWSKS